MFALGFYWFEAEMLVVVWHKFLCDLWAQIMVETDPDLNEFGAAKEL